MNTTVTLWLLLSLGNSYKYPTTTIAQFTSQAECMRVANIISTQQKASTGGSNSYMCVQAEVVK